MAVTIHSSVEQLHVDEETNNKSIKPSLRVKINLHSQYQLKRGVDCILTMFDDRRSDEVEIKEMRNMDLVAVGIGNLISSLGVPVSCREEISSEVSTGVENHLAVRKEMLVSSFTVTADVAVTQTQQEEILEDTTITDVEGEGLPEEEEEEYNDTDGSDSDSIPDLEEEESSDYEMDFDTDNEDRRNKDGAPKHLLDGLKKEVYKGEDGDYGCAICTDTLVCHQSEVIMCPCSHTYHSGCLLKWLLVSNSCPVCRHLVVDMDSDLKLLKKSL